MALTLSSPSIQENSKKENTEHRAAHENPEVLLLNRKGQCGLRVCSNFQFLALSPEKAQHEESGLLAEMADSGSGAGNVPMSLGHLVTPASKETNKHSYNSEATWQRGSYSLINRTPTATGRKSGVFKPFRS